MVEICVCDYIVTVSYVIEFVYESYVALPLMHFNSESKSKLSILDVILSITVLQV